MTVAASNAWSRREAARAGVAEARRMLNLAESEASFQDKVVQLAELCGWEWWHDTDSRRNKAGLPDLLLVRPPRLVFAELKAEKGAVRPAQRQWLELLGRCPGVEAYLWFPSDFEEVKEVLKR